MPSRRDDDRDDHNDYDDYDDRGSLEPHRGTLVLVLGLLSVLVCGLLGPVAWTMGSTDLKKMRAGYMDRAGEGETKAGYICGIIGTIFLGIGLVMAVVWLAVVFLVIGAAPAAR